MDPQLLSLSSINEACTSVGAAKYGRPMGLDEKIKVDLFVTGSVAVDPRFGAQLGKAKAVVCPKHNVPMTLRPISLNACV